MAQAVSIPVRPVLPSEESVCAAMLAACNLMSADKDLSPYDAVGDVMQVYERLKEYQAE